VNIVWTRIQGTNTETLRAARRDTEVRVDPIAPVPPYRQIAEVLRRRIGSGQYRPDTRIPNESELVEEFEVARTVWRRAAGVLREDGLISTVPNRGSYVTRQAS
jgi:GntR family transcriptional regulator